MRGDRAGDAPGAGEVKLELRFLQPVGDSYIGAKVALVGEFARTPRFQGGGSSRVNATRVERLVDTLASRRRVAFAPGFLLSGESDDALVDEAVAAAEASDVVVLCLGLPDAEGEVVLIGPGQEVPLGGKLF